jgi:MurNAc alpha-1-phosphate uridylyltransferase
MEAMILAAGAGTRLRPLTDHTPKALIAVHGRPLLAHVLGRLVEAGATRVIVNTCHHAELIGAFLEGHTPPGVEVALSPEPDGPYDTGAGLLAAAPLFRGDGPFLLHNVDVLSRIPLDALLASQQGARERLGDRLVASVAVQSRATNRHLLFDAEGLMGWENRAADGSVLATQRVRDPVGALRRWSFTGIHALEPTMLDLPHPAGRFSIVSWYLELARLGYAIQPYDASACAWIDVGTPERLAEAEARGA